MSPVNAVMVLVATNMLNSFFGETQSPMREVIPWQEGHGFQSWCLGICCTSQVLDNFPLCCESITDCKFVSRPLGRRSSPVYLQSFLTWSFHPRHRLQISLPNVFCCTLQRTVRTSSKFVSEILGSEIIIFWAVPRIELVLGPRSSWALSHCSTILF